MICEREDCDQLVVPSRPSYPQRFCSVGCRNRAINESKRVRPDQDCIWCGRAFSPHKNGQRYCAKQCSIEATAATESTEQARFWSKVNKDGPVPITRPELGACWIWTGGLDKDGYGVFSRNGGRSIKAHRFVLGLTDEPSTDHLCRVRPCVRPSHLEPVTVQTNTLRGIGLAAVNAKKTHCKRGHEFTPENTNTTDPSRRVCRTCYRDKSRARYATRKQVAI